MHSSGIVLLTGASTGIGRHAAEHLADNGYTVYAGVRKQGDMEKLLSLNNPFIVPLLLDVTDHTSCVTAAQQVMEVALPLVAIVHNAGISRDIVTEFHDVDDARKVFETNFFGVIDLTQLLLPLLRRTKGRIVAISSVASAIGNAINIISSCIIPSF